MRVVSALAIDYRTTRVEAFEDAWADAQLDAGVALAAWRLVAAPARANAYAAYVAALEREQVAALVLADAIGAQR